MYTAARVHSDVFVTPMAAVAGAVADEVLSAMRRATNLQSAYVNNGGDIALLLTGDETFTLAMATPDGRDLGRIILRTKDAIGGIATSGFGGRSLSCGIADSVTVLAADAASADVAATLIANAVNLPDHPAISRCTANQMRDDSDLGLRLVTQNCGSLTGAEINSALSNGAEAAEKMTCRRIIHGAAMFLRGQTRVAGSVSPFTHHDDRSLQIA
jgi:hypothetical protein